MFSSFPFHLKQPNAFVFDHIDLKAFDTLPRKVDLFLVRPEILVDGMLAKGRAGLNPLFC
jgi:hypothetical protein